MKRLTKKDWEDAADLCEQFATDCDTAYENHTVESREWLRKYLSDLSLKITDRALKSKGAA